MIPPQLLIFEQHERENRVGALHGSNGRKSSFCHKDSGPLFALLLH